MNRNDLKIGPLRCKKQFRGTPSRDKLPNARAATKIQLWVNSDVDQRRGTGEPNWHCNVEGRGYTTYVWEAAFDLVDQDAITKCELHSTPINELVNTITSALAITVNLPPNSWRQNACIHHRRSKHEGL